jgi:hypothetical protein
MAFVRPADGIGPAAKTIRWRRRLEGPVTPGPVVGPDGTIYVASNVGVLQCGTMRERWRKPTERIRPESALSANSR